MTSSSLTPSFWRQLTRSGEDAAQGQRRHKAPNRISQGPFPENCVFDFPIPALIPLSSSPQPGTSGSFLAFPPNRPCSYPQMCHICLSIPTGRNLLDGLLATRSVLPTHTSDRGTDHSESHLYSHVRTSSAKALACSPTTPVPAAAPPGVSGSLRQHSRKIYDLREALRPVHCYVSPVRTWHLLRTHKTHIENHRIPPVILPDALPPSDGNSPHREKESGIYLKVSFHPEARSLS